MVELKIGGVHPALPICLSKESKIDKSKILLVSV